MLDIFQAKFQISMQEVAAEQRAKAAAAFDAEISAVDGASDEPETSDMPESAGQSGGLRSQLEAADSEFRV